MPGKWFQDITTGACIVEHGGKLEFSVSSSFAIDRRDKEISVDAGETRL